MHKVRENYGRKPREERGNNLANTTDKGLWFAVYGLLFMFGRFYMKFLSITKK
jgi:hypothetical protein